MAKTKDDIRAPGIWAVERMAREAEEKIQQAEARAERAEKRANEFECALSDVFFAIGCGEDGGRAGGPPPGDLLVRVRSAISHIVRTKGKKERYVTETWPRSVWDAITESLLRGAAIHSEWFESDEGWGWSQADQVEQAADQAEGRIARQFGESVAFAWISALINEETMHDAHRAMWKVLAPIVHLADHTWAGPGWSEYVASEFALSLGERLYGYRRWVAEQVGLALCVFGVRRDIDGNDLFAQANRPRSPDAGI